ncbi:hypothetical protein ACFUC1_13990 [Pedococcus sp. NPDC057267]|uniref:hypothetical protein n=1 Tax=Pedococcus sp. NPDC057267 TaxID=3346077 RepID=UPI00363A3763
MSTQQVPPPVGPGAVLAAVSASAARTARLLATGRLRQPDDLVGMRLPFRDGTRSMIFRTTERRPRDGSEPSVLQVRFRLRWIGERPSLHRVFVTTCIVNTPLFAGFPGFVRKQWMVDPLTFVYRGLYDWDGADRARWYAERLRHVLALVSVPGSIEYVVVPGLGVDDVLRDGRRLQQQEAGDVGAEPLWWELAG